MSDRVDMAIVGGGGSTGTHLLASLLHCIGSIRVGPEVNLTHQKRFYDEATFRSSFFRSLTGRNDTTIARTPSGARYELVPNRVLDSADFYGLRDGHALLRTFDRCKSFADLIHEVKRRAAERWKWPAEFLWLEHSPRNSICAKEFLEAFPEEKFIHLVRDGRDAMLSQTNRFARRFPEAPFEEMLYLAVQLWCVLQNGALMVADHPHTLRISYEQLVTEPLRTINQVLTHLGRERIEAEEFEQHRGKSFPDLGFTRQSGWDFDLRGEISTEGIGKFRGGFTAEHLEMLEVIPYDYPIHEERQTFSQLQRTFGYQA